MTGIPYKEIIEYLNQKIGTHFRTETEFYQKFIKERWIEGFVLDDFCKVIDNKAEEWLGTDRSVYLRPETLFGKKFQSYLNQQNGKIRPSQFSPSNEVKEYSWQPNH